MITPMVGCLDSEGHQHISIGSGSATPDPDADVPFEPIWGTDAVHIKRARDIDEYGSFDKHGMSSFCTSLGISTTATRLQLPSTKDVVSFNSNEMPCTGAPRDCSNCGGKHPTKECTKPRAKCPFEFGDGTTCTGEFDCASVPMQTLTHYTLYPASLYY